jgi:hypothetical protein
VCVIPAKTDGMADSEYGIFKSYFEQVHLFYKKVLQLVTQLWVLAFLLFDLVSLILSEMPPLHTQPRMRHNTRGEKVED